MRITSQYHLKGRLIMFVDFKVNGVTYRGKIQGTLIKCQRTGRYWLARMVNIVRTYQVN